MYRHKRCVYKSLREFRPDGAVQRKGGEKLRSKLLYNKMMSPINQQLRPKKEFPRSQFRGRRSTRCTERIKNKKKKNNSGNGKENVWENVAVVVEVFSECNATGPQDIKRRVGREKNLFT